MEKDSNSLLSHWHFSQICNSCTRNLLDTVGAVSLFIRMQELRVLVSACMMLLSGLLKCELV